MQGFQDNCSVPSGIHRGHSVVTGSGWIYTGWCLAGDAGRLGLVELSCQLEYLYMVSLAW